MAVSQVTPKKQQGRYKLQLLGYTKTCFDSIRLSLGIQII